MRKHFAWYLNGFRGASEARARIFAAKDEKEIIRILNEIENF